MAETQSAHRQKLEWAVVQGNVRSQAMGQWFAFVLGLIVIVAGVWMVITDRTTVGLGLILGDVLTLAGIFLGARSSAKKERAERRADLGQ